MKQPGEGPWRGARKGARSCSLQIVICAKQIETTNGSVGLVPVGVWWLSRCLARAEPAAWPPDCPTDMRPPLFQVVAIMR